MGVLGLTTVRFYVTSGRVLTGKQSNGFLGQKRWTCWFLIIRTSGGGVWSRPISNARRYIDGMVEMFLANPTGWLGEDRLREPHACLVASHVGRTKRCTAPSHTNERSRPGCGLFKGNTLSA